MEEPVKLMPPFEDYPLAYFFELMCSASDCAGSIGTSSPEAPHARLRLAQLMAGVRRTFELHGSKAGVDCPDRMDSRLAT